MANPSFAASRVGLANLWAKATISADDHARAVAAARKLIANRARYEAVQAKTGVPWWWIACVHWRESSGDFAGVLHNGERIIGTGRRTKLVPAGRGPFATWEEAAIDALTMPGKQLDRITDWSIPRALYQWERFNGTGYIARGVNSPYLFAATSLQQRGKYIADGKWSSTAWDEQLGTVAIAKALVELDPHALDLPSKPSPAIEIGAATGAVVAATAAGVPSPIVVGAAVVVLVILAANARQLIEGKAMFSAIFANWKTSTAGGAGILGAVIDILVQINTGSFDLGRLMTDATVIATALGLFAASDAPKAAAK